MGEGNFFQRKVVASPSQWMVDECSSSTNELVGPHKAYTKRFHFHLCQECDASALTHVVADGEEKATSE